MLCSCPVSTPSTFLFGGFSHIMSLPPLPASEAKPSRHWRTDTHPESAQAGLLGLDSGGSAVRKQTSAGSFPLAGLSGVPRLSWALPSISGAAYTGGSGGALWDSPTVTRHCSWWCSPTPDSLVIRELVWELPTVVRYLCGKSPSQALLLSLEPGHHLCHTDQVGQGSLRLGLHRPGSLAHF